MTMRSSFRLLLYSYVVFFNDLVWCSDKSFTTPINIFKDKYPSKGEAWPKPQIEIKNNLFYIYNSVKLDIVIEAHTCQILEKAVTRYRNLLIAYNISIGESKLNKNTRNSIHYRGKLNQMRVNLMKPCEAYPYLDMDESYELSISDNSHLTSSSIWGILRGLETFFQLFYFTNNYSEVRINFTEIKDYPKYSHRGLLLDTSRHFISMSKILKTLDAMASNKMNVFHWHIVDDQSFPYQSAKFPELSARGAHSKYSVYSEADIDLIVNYARDRGIRVIPEINVPGHTLSWGFSHPEVQTKCYKKGTHAKVGPLDPTNNKTYALIKDLFKEVKEIFRDQYFHVGGDVDGVVLQCWDSNPEIKNFMQKQNIGSPSALHAYFTAEMLRLLDSNTKTIVWQDVYENKATLPKDTLVQTTGNGLKSNLISILRSGYRVVYSTPWYTERANIATSWQKFYQEDPRDLIQRPGLEKGIVGGEACNWVETMDDHVISRVWPGITAFAERLWTNEAESIDKVTHRIKEQWRRMMYQGLVIHSGPAKRGLVNRLLDTVTKKDHLLLF